MATKTLKPCVLKKDQQEHFNLKRGWMVNAWRLVDPTTGHDLVQPWFEKKGLAREFAKDMGLKIIREE